MTNRHGEFIWYELMTADADAAQAFYSAVIGWDIASSGQPGMDYRIATMAGAGIAGIMTLSDEMIAGGARPGWLGYLGVNDVDAAVVGIRQAGGNVLLEPQDIPDVGRFAFVSDPQGVPFYVMRGNSDQASQAFAAEAPRIGHCAWNELATTDQASAMAFYTGQFGWEHDGDMDMGPMGSYQFLRHGPVIGAMFSKPPEMPEPAWTYYFRVADVDVATALALANGGTITVQPHEVPGGDYIVAGIDPTGAAFALVGAQGART